MVGSLAVLLERMKNPGSIGFANDNSASADSTGTDSTVTVSTSAYYTGINETCQFYATTGGSPMAAAASTRPIAVMTQGAFTARLGPAFKNAPQSTQSCDQVPAKRQTWGTLKLLYR